MPKLNPIILLSTHRTMFGLVRRGAASATQAGSSDSIFCSSNTTKNSWAAARQRAASTSFACSCLPQGPRVVVVVVGVGGGGGGGVAPWLFLKKKVKYSLRGFLERRPPQASTKIKDIVLFTLFNHVQPASRILAPSPRKLDLLLWWNSKY